MTYLVTYQQDGEQLSFYTNWFDPENHFVHGMIVFNLLSHKFTTDGINWQEIQEDSL